jgi:ATP:ADP antiporter, AAA family
MIDETLQQPPEFSKWRKRLWPVYGQESKKFFLLLLMKLCVSFVYTILHATKDTLVVTAKGSGAEAIPILKGWFVLFFAFLFMLVFSKMSNHLSRNGLFYATLMPFICFFMIYGFFLYPNRDWLCPHEASDWLVSHIGVERSHWVAVFRYWMDSIFFLMAELWGGVVIGLSFWGFANRINSLNEASRFYSLLTAGGHIGVILAGPLIWHFANAFTDFSFTVQWLMGLVTAAGLLIIAIYWWINRYIVKSPQMEQNKKAEPATKLSLIQSLQHLLRSPSLGCIALMVIGYSLSVNMIEVIWKATLKLQYPNPKEYEAFMGMLTSIIGSLSFLLALFVGGNVIRKFGWYVAAQTTPIILGLASVFFLGAFFSINIWSSEVLFNGITALSVLVVCGAIHNISCKSMKYCFFDPTKEMAYIPLDEETKVKGKAAVDVVASRFGKSGSSWVQVFIMEMAGVGSVLSIVPYIAPIVILAVIGWIISVYYLRSQIEKKTEKMAT